LFNFVSKLIQDSYGWPNLQIAPSSQILLKILTDSVMYHVSANMIATHVDLKKKIENGWLSVRQPLPTNDVICKLG
jgi:hypothetical protein